MARKRNVQPVDPTQFEDDDEAEDEAEEEDEAGDAEDVEEEPKVKRPLSREQVQERDQQLSRLYRELRRLEEKHLRSAQKHRTKVRGMKATLDRLAQEIEEQAEWVPAQLELPAASRAAHKRAAQRPGAEHGIK